MVGVMSDRLITSLTNDTVKAVRALHMRKEREATGRFLAEGLKFIGEALDQGRAPRLLMVGEDARPHPILDRAREATRAAGGEVVVVTHAILEKISRRDNPQTVLGVFEQVYAPLSAIARRTMSRRSVARARLVNGEWWYGDWISPAMSAASPSET